MPASHAKHRPKWWRRDLPRRHRLCVACELLFRLSADTRTSPAPTRFVSVPDYDEEYNDCDDDDYDGTEYGINHPVNMGKGRRASPSSSSSPARRRESLPSPPSAPSTRRARTPPRLPQPSRSLATIQPRTT